MRNVSLKAQLFPQDILQDMDPTWATTVLLVPCVVVLTAGFFHLYGVIMGLLSKTSVRNKVVVITDALSGLGRGNEGSFGAGRVFSVCGSHPVLALCTKSAPVLFTKEARG